ncbi:MAG: hypothetical protein Q8L37_07580 [Candidatus Gottesmanbacteria bacterium]|nr:hypothetical protein [Candidatus Gottesmanbacteria bacterium]
MVISSVSEENIFYELLDNTKDNIKYAFENNWPYILQATRNGYMTYGDTETKVYYTKRFPNVERSPIVIVNALGRYPRECISKLALNNHKNNINTIVKNVPSNNLQWWLENNFTETTTPWSHYSIKDDNTFPQYIVLNETILLKGFKEDVKYQINRFQKRPISTIQYSENYNKEAMRLLDDFSIYSQNKGNDYANEVKNGHLFFFDNLIQKRIRFAHIENDRLIGFSFLTPVNNIIFYNAVICQYERNIMKYLVYQSLKLLAERNIYKYFCMQGSENEGQDYLKKRLGASIVIQKTHLTYSP